MAWVEQRAGVFRVRLRLPDGTVVTDSAHPTKPAAQIRAKEIDVELAKETFLDPREGKIPLREWVAIWEQTHEAGRATCRPTAATCANTSCPASATFR